MLSQAQTEVKRFEPHRYHEIVTIADGNEELIEQRCQALVDQWEDDAIDEQDNYLGWDDPWSYLR